MTKNIAFITDPLSQLDIQTDTTCALMREAQNRGHQVFWMEVSDLHIKHDKPVGYMCSIQIHDHPDQPFSLGPSFVAPLDDLSLIWWRKSPPYQLEHLFALDALQMLSKARVLNNPRTLRNLNEHLFPLQLPQMVPPTLVTKNPKAIHGFIAEMGGKIVLRRLDSATHQNNFYLRMGDANLNMLTQVLTQNGTQYVFAQKLVTESGLDGDKRIFLLDGKLLGVALQLPAKGEMRGSFERGSEAGVAKLSDKDQRLLQSFGAKLRENGIFFATMDVADGFVFDFNFSCPNGLVQLQQVSQADVLGSVFGALGL